MPQYLKDQSYAPDAVQALKLDANELLKLGIVDRVLEEPVGGLIVTDATAQELQDALISELENLKRFLQRIFLITATKNSERWEKFFELFNQFVKKII